MMYNVEFTPKAISQMMQFRKHNGEATSRKLANLIKELSEHPKTGTGKPHELRHKFSGVWSRRINQKDRLLYRIEDQRIVVIVIAVGGHYEDK